jgi:hypothetical protein
MAMIQTLKRICWSIITNIGKLCAARAYFDTMINVARLKNKGFVDRLLTNQSPRPRLATSTFELYKRNRDAISKYTSDSVCNEYLVKWFLWLSCVDMYARIVQDPIGIDLDECIYVYKDYIDKATRRHSLKYVIKTKLVYEQLCAHYSVPDSLRAKLGTYVQQMDEVVAYLQRPNH